MQKQKRAIAATPGMADLEGLGSLTDKMISSIVEVGNTGGIGVVIKNVLNDRGLSLVEDDLMFLFVAPTREVRIHQDVNINNWLGKM